MKMKIPIAYMVYRVSMTSTAVKKHQLYGEQIGVYQRIYALYMLGQ